MTFRNELVFTKSKNGAIILSRSGLRVFGSATINRADLNSIGIVARLHRFETQETAFKSVTMESVRSKVGSSLRTDSEGFATSKYPNMLARSSFGRLSIVVAAGDMGAAEADSTFAVSSGTASVTVPKSDSHVDFTIDPPDACAVSGDILAAVLMYVGVEMCA